MRILIIEDSDQLAEPIVQELRREHSHAVQWVSDPIQARRLAGPFDIIVVDLLFEHLSRDFDNRRAARQVSLTRDQLLITGLTAVDDFSQRMPDAKFVLWTSGEANRRLHLYYAEEELGIRSFCSKSSGTGRADVLHKAIVAASEGRRYADPVVDAYLKPDHARSIGDTIFREGSHRAVWRAVALGAGTRDEIAAITGYSKKTVGNLMTDLLDRLMELDSGLVQPSRPLNEVVRYASRNWEFLLDNAVKRRFP